MKIIFKYNGTFNSEINGNRFKLNFEKDKQVEVSSISGISKKETSSSTIRDCYDVMTKEGILIKDVPVDFFTVEW